MKTSNSELIGQFLAISLFFLLAIGGSTGWVFNVIKVAKSDFSHIDGELVVRVIGIPMAPVGAIAGWLP